jgi:hypothetical protein
MPEVKAYTGGCHCGQVRYDATVDLSRVMSCNCSICSKRGALWTFVAPEQFALRAGEQALIDYQFYKKRFHHLFCPDCGVESFARGTTPDGNDVVAINVRCLDHVELGSLTLTPFDGKSL